MHLLKAAGFHVSVDSGDIDELRRGARAGADFVLSLTEATLDAVAGTAALPVLIPSAPGDLDSLVRAEAAARGRGLAAILDPILDSIHFGFTESLLRYAEIRRRLPHAELLIGTGNLTELTDADTSGITAMLLGICSELAIRNVLIVQVSPHTRRTVAEHDLARRIMHAAGVNSDLPRGYASGLLQVHDRSPFGETADDIAASAAELRDRNFRIAVARDGIHLYNAAMHEIRHNAMDFFPLLDVADDGAHAFYLGTELMKPEIAFNLGKRFTQDGPLDWGCAVPPRPRNATRLSEAGHTLRAKKHDP